MKQVLEISTMTTFEEIMKDILEQDNIIFSVRSGSTVCEARTEQGLPLRIRDQWATIGDVQKNGISMSIFKRLSKQSL